MDSSFSVSHLIPHKNAGGIDILQTLAVWRYHIWWSPPPFFPSIFVPAVADDFHI